MAVRGLLQVLITTDADEELGPLRIQTPLVAATKQLLHLPQCREENLGKKKRGIASITGMRTNSQLCYPGLPGLQMSTPHLNIYCRTGQSVH